MRALFIGGTGNISTPVSRLAIERGWELYLLNRGKRPIAIDGAQSIVADIHEPRQVADAIGDMQFDVVVNWIAFNESDIQRDIDLFAGRTRQYIFISSASAYQKPPSHPVITESTPLANPFWQYSRDKIACENRLLQAYREQGFPVTIVRPSHTYDTVIPVAIGGWSDYTIVDRIRKGQALLVHGDGTSLWTVTHADDFAIGFVGLMAHSQAIGHAFHITSDESLTWDQIYRTVADALGHEANLVHVPSEVIADVAESLGNPNLRGTLLGDKSCSVIFDNTKIKTFVPEYCATIRFDQGIGRTLAWFEADASRQKINPENNKLIDTVIARYRRGPSYNA